MRLWLQVQYCYVKSNILTQHQQLIIHNHSLNDYTSNWIQVYEKMLEITKINFFLDIYDLTLFNILFLQL